MSAANKGRDAILGAIRANLGARGDEPGRRGAVRARLERSPEGLIPERAQLDQAERIDQFTASIKAQGAVLREIETLDQLPGALAEQLADFNLPAKLRRGEDPVLASLNWDDTMIEVDTGPATSEDAVSLSRAMVAAAETGTLALVSGADNPSTLNFLPETHFVVLFADDLAASYESVWDRLRQIYGRGELPRTVNFVSGPSATADIEQTLIRGAHGPRRLAIFLILNSSK